jgi:hypothetical protein
MDAPDPDLATHLIAITPLPDGQSPADVRDSNFAPTEDYTDGVETAYLGVVEGGGGSEQDTAIARPEGIDMFTVVIFARDDPGMTTHARVRWAKRPDNFANPAVGSSGVITLPGGWTPEAEGTAQANARARDKGCWLGMVARNIGERRLLRSLLRLSIAAAEMRRADAGAGTFDAPAVRCRRDGDGIACDVVRVPVRWADREGDGR